MRNLLRLLILVPVAVVAVFFALANRQPVKLAIDLPGDNALGWQILGWQIEAPLFGIVFAVLALGVLIGGTASWLAQGKHRKAERFHRAEARRLRDELDLLRQQGVNAPRIENS